jgi:hypothetical protein
MSILQGPIDTDDFGMGDEHPHRSNWDRDGRRWRLH